MALKTACLFPFVLSGGCAVVELFETGCNNPDQVTPQLIADVFMDQDAIAFAQVCQ